MTYVMHELSRQKALQLSLRNELYQCVNTETSKLADRLDGLPLLDAIIMETLRLHSANPGPWPRRTPALGCRVGTYPGIPAGTVISASSYALHRNATVYPEPDDWRPERWLLASIEERKEMLRWFWAFGSGARMCIGNHFAFRVMKSMVAMIYSEFETSIVDDDGMEQVDGVVAGPVGNKLILRFREVGGFKLAEESGRSHR